VGEPLTAAGWYPDPAGAPMLRYFDGRDWTEHRVPVAAAPSTDGVMTNPRPRSATAVIAGVLAILGGLLWAIPIEGLSDGSAIRGTTTNYRIRPGHGSTPPPSCLPRFCCCRARHCSWPANGWVGYSSSSAAVSTSPCSPSKRCSRLVTRSLRWRSRPLRCSRLSPSCWRSHRRPDDGANLPYKTGCCGANSRRCAELDRDHVTYGYSQSANVPVTRGPTRLRGRSGRRLRVRMRRCGTGGGG
jgi:hypothetical protein